MIVIRNPIDRFISAFNWRYKLVVLDKTQEERFVGEKNTLIKYSRVNNLSENIGDFSGYFENLSLELKISVPASLGNF